VTDHPTEDVPRSILVICAHPDDVDFGAAGSVATWTRAGAEVTYCMVTSGQAGSDDRTQTADEIAANRVVEQTAAAATLGVTDLIWLGHSDGAVVSSLELRRDLSRVIRQVRPDRVVTQSPELNLDRIYASHPDHVATGTAALAAVYPDARNPHSHTELLAEGLEPHTVPEVWLMAGPTTVASSRVHVDTTDVIDLKISALRCHVSQTGHRADLDEMIRAWAALTAAECGLAEGRLAEAFRRVDTR
jgi:LmbE family N-acetylglucosaminyl deacetylase